MLPQYPSKGFTLVELLVSLAITSIIMLGMSVFFAGTFRQLFDDQTQASNHQDHFVVMELLRSKMEHVKRVIENGGDFLLIQNNLSQDELPFSYVGLKDNRLVFKDFMMFGGLHEEDTVYDSDLLHPTGITHLNDQYYIAVPQENTIYQCSQIDDCSPFLSEGLNHPMDVATNGVDLLFVSDSGNDRILQISNINAGNQVTTLVEGDLSFPTGLAYYLTESGDDYLFVSDTYHHQIKRMSLGETVQVEAVMGDGERFDCGGSPQYCQLNFPTGLHLDDEHQLLYIADTGHGRILTLNEPSLQVDVPANLELSFDLEQHRPYHRFVLPGDFDDEQYDPEATTLITQLSDYSSVWNELVSGTQDPLILSDFGDCQSDSNDVYLETFPAGYDLDEDDVLLIDGVVATVQHFSGEVVCTQGEDEEAINELRTHIQVSSDGTVFNHGDLLYFSHPLETTIVLTDVVYERSGFKKIPIDLFDSGDLYSDPVESHSLTFRVGDGLLGTAEDVVQVFASDLAYPTGLSMSSDQVNVASTSDDLETNLLRFDSDGMPIGSPQSIGSFSIKNISTFDYKSDVIFDGLSFTELNEGRLLGMQAAIQVKTDRTKAYQFTTHLP